ncbi:MAG: hypothetical protein ACI8Y4_001888 [Candidatus Poriferisodalaceae bacterium]|jgi:hypothetical protein
MGSSRSRRLSLSLVALAEFEVWHTRPVAPTRRIALGEVVLPLDPAPGFGGLLLAGVVAVFAEQLDDGLRANYEALLNMVLVGQRVSQPRLRHRLQEDRIGLCSSHHKLVGREEQLVFEIEPDVGPEPQLLAVAYLIAREPAEKRRSLLTLIASAMQWRGGDTPDLIPYLTGRAPTGAWARATQIDPTSWAMGVLGFDAAPDRREVQSRFRRLLRTAHPDHGGRGDDAGERIQELSEARRILLGRKGA